MLLALPLPPDVVDAADVANENVVDVRKEEETPSSVHPIFRAAADGPTDIPPVLTASEVVALASNYAATRNVDVSQYFLAIVSFDYVSRQWMLVWLPIVQPGERKFEARENSFSILASDAANPKLNFTGPKQ